MVVIFKLNRTLSDVTDATILYILPDRDRRTEGRTHTHREHTDIHYMSQNEKSILWIQSPDESSTLTKHTHARVCVCARVRACVRVCVCVCVYIYIYI